MQDTRQEKLHFVPAVNKTHIYNRNPAAELLQYISNDRGIQILDAQASWLGGLATSGLGDALLDEHGNPISKSKSDVLIKLTTDRGVETVGISVKTCNKKTPTNDQMFFTTARAWTSVASHTDTPTRNAMNRIATRIAAV